MEKPSGTSANSVEFHVLGALTVVRDGRVCELGPPRQRAVLARLLMSSPATVAAERFIEDVWAGRQPASALGVLQAHISTLRRVLEPDRAPRAAADSPGSSPAPRSSCIPVMLRPRWRPRMRPTGTTERSLAIASGKAGR